MNLKNESSYSSSSSLSSVSTFATVQTPVNILNHTPTTTTTTTSTINRIQGTPMNFFIVQTLDQFKSILVHESYQDKIIVVRFFAPWCKVCNILGNTFSHSKKNIQ
jgi:hypothetical protein